MTNVYKILVDSLYSPMLKTLAVYILNPFLFIYYYVIETDFMTGNKRNYFYFIINLIFTLSISFFWYVFKTGKDVRQRIQSINNEANYTLYAFNDNEE